MKLVNMLSNVMIALEWGTAPGVNAAEDLFRVFSGNADGYLEIRVAPYGIDIGYTLGDVRVGANVGSGGVVVVDVNWPSIGARSPEAAAAFGRQLCTAAERAQRLEELLRTFGPFSKEDVREAVAWLEQHKDELYMMTRAARSEVPA